MNSFTLIWGALKRRKARTIFTFLSVVVAFMLFCILAAVRQGQVGPLAISVAQRLVTSNKIARSNPLPLSYYNKIATVSGVNATTYLNGFTGYYKDPRNQFQIFFFSSSFLRVFPEVIVPLAQRRAWLHDRQGALAGSLLAKRMGWKVGDTIPVESKTLQKDGSTTWYFHLSGIYHTALSSAYQNFFIGHYAYFNEGVADPRGHDSVYIYFERIADARKAQSISSAIDRLFDNSSPQTLTQSQQLETISFIRQYGNVSAITIFVGLAVFFTLLVIISNTLNQSIHERIAEFAIYRVLGFTRLWLVKLVLQESLLLITSAAICGLILGYELTQLLYGSVGAYAPTFGLTWSAIFLGILLSILCGVWVAIIPVLQVTRLHVSDALRRT